MIQFQLLATAYTFLEYLYSRITKFKNKGSDNLCQALIKLNLVFSTEFKFTSGIYLFIQPPHFLYQGVYLETGAVYLHNKKFSAILLSEEGFSCQGQQGGYYEGGGLCCIFVVSMQQYTGKSPVPTAYNHHRKFLNR